MSTPQAKRRRLNDATKTLHKPFKSPFRTPLKPSLGSGPPSSDPPDIGIPSVSTASNSGIIQERPVSFRPSLDHSTTDAAKPLLPRPSIPTPTRIPRSQKKVAPSRPSLTREIVDLRNDVQILSQAHALATSSNDSDLLILVERWRTASRAAAEELFATTRDRVNRMGGVGAWKDREREHKEWKVKAERDEMEAERERLEEAREKGQVSEDVYEQYAYGEIGTEHEEIESFKAADDDVSWLLKILVVRLY
ncbi:hypothetical protein PMIN03_012382 [Paraphaeosphaeria minitans]